MELSNIISYSNIDKKLLLNKINEFKNKKRDYKIFNLICTNNINYSNNDNGVFFDLNQLDDKILKKIEHILLYYDLKQKKNIEVFDSSEKLIY